MWLSTGSTTQALDAVRVHAGCLAAVESAALHRSLSAELDCLYGFNGFEDVDIDALVHIHAPTFNKAHSRGHNSGTFPRPAPAPSAAAPALAAAPMPAAPPQHFPIYNASHMAYAEAPQLAAGYGSFEAAMNASTEAHNLTCAYGAAAPPAAPSAPRSSFQALAAPPTTSETNAATPFAPLAAVNASDEDAWLAALGSCLTAAAPSEAEAFDFCLQPMATDIFGFEADAIGLHCHGHAGGPVGAPTGAMMPARCLPPHISPQLVPITPPLHGGAFLHDDTHGFEPLCLDFSPMPAPPARQHISDARYLAAATCALRACGALLPAGAAGPAAGLADFMRRLDESVASLLMVLDFSRAEALQAVEGRI